MSEGLIVIDKGIDLQSLKMKAETIHAKGPATPQISKKLRLMIRAELTDQMNDARDTVNDEAVFGLVIAEMLPNIIHLIYEHLGAWTVPRKSVLSDLTQHVPDVGNWIRCIVSQEDTSHRLISLEKLVDYALDPLGGQLTSECILINRKVE